jgi:hypothetical protein
MLMNFYAMIRSGLIGNQFVTLGVMLFDAILITTKTAFNVLKRKYK